MVAPNPYDDPDGYANPMDHRRWATAFLAVFCATLAALMYVACSR